MPSRWWSPSPSPSPEDRFGVGSRVQYRGGTPGHPTFGTRANGRDALRVARISRRAFAGHGLAKTVAMNRLLHAAQRAGRTSKRRVSPGTSLPAWSGHGSGGLGSYAGSR